MVTETTNEMSAVDEQVTEAVSDATTPVVTPGEAGEAGEADTSPHDSGLRSKATEYGLTDDDISGLDGPRLERMFTAMDRRIMQPVIPAVTPVQTGVTPVEAGAQAGKVGYSPFKLELPEELDEPLAKTFQGVVDHLNAQMAEVNQFRQMAATELAAMNMLRDFDGFDRFIEALGDDWEKDYGRGPTVDLNPNSAAFKKRLEVFTGSRSLADDFARRGMPMPRSDSWTRSHRAVHWDRVSELERKKLAGRVDGRQRQFAERPGKGGKPERSVDELALAALRGERT